MTHHKGSSTLMRIKMMIFEKRRANGQLVNISKCEYSMEHDNVDVSCLSFTDTISCSELLHLVFRVNFFATIGQHNYAFAFAK